MTNEDPKPEETFTLPADFDMSAFESRLDPDSKALVDEMRADALGLPLERREAIEHDVQEFLGEMALSEWVQLRAEEHIRHAKELARGTAAETLAEPRSITLNGSKIGWIPGESNITVALDDKEKADKHYLFGSIVTQSRTTQQAFEHLQAEGVADHLIELLQTQSLPRFIEDLHSGSRRLRPSNKTNTKGTGMADDRNLDTDYAAYKLDVQGTRNRAIILLPGKIDDIQVIILAAIYDHEDQAKVLNAIGAH